MSPRLRHRGCRAMTGNGDKPSKPINDEPVKNPPPMKPISPPPPPPPKPGK